jgi:hypothetical protein
MATASTDVTASGAELITGVFPRPIAPPTESETGAPLPMPRSSALPRPAEVPDPSDHAENEPTALPSIPLPIPSIALAVGSSAATNPYDAPLPRALAAAPAPAPSVEAELDDWSGPGVWEALPSPARDDGALDALPLPASDTEDLPSWDAGGFSAGTRVSKQLEAMMEILKRDAYTSFVGAMAVSLILLLLAAAMMRACA